MGALYRGDWRITVRNIGSQLQISVGSAEILVQRLIYSKVSARWVLRLLVPEHNEKRLVIVTQLLQGYEKNGVNFLEYILNCYDRLMLNMLKTYVMPLLLQISRYIK